MSPQQGSIRSKAEGASKGKALSSVPRSGPRAGSSAKASDDVFNVILDRIRTGRNFDFRNYKRATLRRRIQRRIADSGSATPEKYLALLDRDPGEMNLLLSTMLIKVTSFFRDGDPWEVLLKRILPELIANRSPTELRIWCAGCATGEEAFSVAILLAEVLGPAFSTFPVKVFGTDADDGAVAYARRAIYSPHQVRGLSGEMLARWFLPCAEGFTVRKEIRRVVVFGVNNLVSDAPISRLDLLICRNVFIYLDTELQRRVLARFQYSLRRDGVLLLGKSELIPFAAKIFRPIDLPSRLYKKDDQTAVAFSRRDDLAGGSAGEGADDGGGDGRRTSFHRDAIESIQLPLIMTALDGTVTLWNRAAAQLWKRREEEVVGKRLAALGLPGLTGNLLIEKTNLVRDGKSTGETSEGVIALPGVEPSVAIAIQVSPLVENGEGAVGLLYLAQDVTPFRKLENEMQRANDDRRKANEELQLANEALQSSNEELETTNEELQSTNEELETTNEELQSTNEELETTNEELQSTNEELDTTNRELAHRTDELNHLSSYHRIISRSLSAAVVVLDAAGRITMWNLAADRLLGLPEAEAVGQSFWSLGVPALKKTLVKRLRLSLASARAARLDGVTYQLPTGGRGFASIAAVPFVDGGQYQGAVILFEDTTKATVLARELRELQESRMSREKRA